MPPTVAFAELPDSPQEAWTEEGFSATMRLMCAWDVRNTLAAGIMAERAPYPRIPATGAYPRSATPAPFPAKLTQAAVWGAGTLADYESAIVTVEYDTNGPNEDLISESLTPNAEFMTLDHEGFKWTGEEGDDLTENEAAGKLVRGFDYNLTFHQAPFIPSAVLTLPGYVNDVAVDSYTLGLTFAAETLLFSPCTTSRRTTALMVEAWELPYKFSYRATGWNKHWRKTGGDGTGGWESIYQFVITAGFSGWVEYKNYPPGDFSKLFPE